MHKTAINVAIFTLLTSTLGQAGTDKVYSPTVDQGEWEMELRGTYSRDGDPASDRKHKQKFGLGYGVAEHLFLEGYAITEKGPDEDYKVEAFELEAVVQLSEQGEYAVDLGFLAEVEREREDNVWEIKGGPILQKQIGDWLATLNLLLEQKLGPDREEDDAELLGAGQVRYRLHPDLEPAVEYYYDEETQSAGPVVLGAFRLGRPRVEWEAGVLFGFTHETPDQTYRWLLEIEY